MSAQVAAAAARAARPSDLAGPVAVVTGADHPTGLGAGRALHRAGARVIGVTRNGSTPPCRSRVWRPLRVLDRDAERDWIGTLVALGADLPEPPFLMPTQDQLVADISRRRDELGAFRFVLPPDGIVQAFLDKTLFYAWALPRGLPLPASRVVEDAAELRTALREMPYPLVLKPLYRTAAWDRLSPVDKAIRFESAADLDRMRFDPLSTASALILSQWIEGPDSAVHYCLAYCEKPGQVRACYTGRKLLQFPRQTGSTAICVGTQNGEMREIAEEVFGQAGYVGIGSVEVKYGPDGRPYITEPTVGRPNLQSYSAVSAGWNLHALAMAHALGLEWEAPRRYRNCWWIQEDAVLELATSRGGEAVPWRLLAGQALRARRVAGAYWTWWDPAPAGALLGGKVGRRLRRLRRRTG